MPPKSKLTKPRKPASKPRVLRKPVSKPRVLLSDTALLQMKFEQKLLAEQALEEERAMWFKQQDEFLRKQKKFEDECRLVQKNGKLVMKFLRSTGVSQLFTINEVAAFARDPSMTNAILASYAVQRLSSMSE